VWQLGGCDAPRRRRTLAALRAADWLDRFLDRVRRRLVDQMVARQPVAGDALTRAELAAAVRRENLGVLVDWHAPEPRTWLQIYLPNGRFFQREEPARAARLRHAAPAP
jgi:hypothetical protein